MSKRILVVEDEEVVRKSLRLMLRKWGHEVTEAGDGEEAILSLARGDFDLMICDVMMPRKDGWQLLQELRSSPKKGNIPVIILTAKGRLADMFKSYQLGATYFMTKPFTKKQLQFGLDLIFSQRNLPSDAINLSDLCAELEEGEREEHSTNA